MGKRFLLTLTFLSTCLRGNDTIADLLRGKQVYISFITELELIGYPKITIEDEVSIHKLLASCHIISLDQPMKTQYVAVRRNYGIKLADAIVAASAITTNLPLLTADKGFSKIVELSVLLYEHQV